MYEVEDILKEEMVSSKSFQLIIHLFIGFILSSFVTMELFKIILVTSACYKINEQKMYFTEKWETGSSRKVARLQVSIVYSF